MHSIFISPTQTRLDWFRKSLEGLDNPSIHFDFMIDTKEELKPSNEHVLFLIFWIALMRLHLRG
ncbi:MAG: hypothetical protein ACKO5E_08555 [bacterium]